MTVAWRDGRKAIEYAERAVAMTERRDGVFLVTLAAAYAEAGKFEMAIKTQKEAMAILKDDTENHDLTRKLELYEAGKPFHETE